MSWHLTKSLVLRALAALALALVLAFVAVRATSMFGDLGGVPPVERPWLFAPGLALYAATLLTFALLWREVVVRLDRVRPPLIDALAVFLASWLGRYVPGILPYAAGKFAMGLRIGHSKAALAASVLYENAIVLSIGAISSSIIIPVALAGDGSPRLFIGAGLAGIAGLALLSPPVFHKLIGLATRLARRSSIPRASLLSYRGILAGGALATLAMVLNGAGFAFVLSAFVELSAAELLASAAIFNLAGVVGVAVLPVPSGLGVREAVLIGLLQVFVPIEIAAAAALLVRVGGLGIDVVAGLAGAGAFALRLRRHAEAVERLPQRELEAA